MADVAGFSTGVWLDRIAAIQGGKANSGRLSLKGHLEGALKQVRSLTVTDHVAIGTGAAKRRTRLVHRGYKTGCPTHRPTVRLCEVVPGWSEQPASTWNPSEAVHVLDVSIQV